jgi:tRNA-dihydrouridine synthase B
VMIARGAYGRPWFLRQVMDYLRTGAMTPAPDINEIGQVIREHYEGMLQCYGEHLGVMNARKHLGWYLAHLPESEAVYTEIKTIKDSAIVKEKLQSYFIQ